MDHRTAPALKRWVFARHSNPWSAWSRWATTPLVVLPFWTRSRADATVVAAWMLINPVIFPEPADDRAWSTKAMLGEQRWSDRLRFDKATLLNVLSTAAMGTAMAGGRRKSAKLAVPAVAAQMILTLMFWKLMVDFHGDRERPASITSGYGRRSTPSPTTATSSRAMT